MGLYLRNNWYHYKKQIQGKAYYRALKIKKGKEHLLSERLAQIEDEIVAEHFGLSYQSSKNITFNEFITIYLEAKRYKKSIHRDKQSLDIISNILKDPVLSAINRKHINRLESYLIDRRKLKHSTVNRYFEVLKHFFNLAITDKYLTSNPLDSFQFFVEDGTRKALTEEEIVKILKASDEIQKSGMSPIFSVIHDLIVFALNTGLRLSEILNLKKSSIINNEYLYIPITETKYRRRSASRTRKAKVIYINSIALSIINKYLTRDEYVFPLPNRNPNVIRKVIHKIRKLTGIKDFTFHQIRHNVSTVISSQADLATAKLVLGHSDMKTTLKYTHPERAAQKDAVAKLETYFRELYERT